MSAGARPLPFFAAQLHLELSREQRAHLRAARQADREALAALRAALDAFMKRSAAIPVTVKECCEKMFQNDSYFQDHIRVAVNLQIADLEALRDVAKPVEADLPILRAHYGARLHPEDFAEAICSVNLQRTDAAANAPAQNFQLLPELLAAASHRKSLDDIFDFLNLDPGAPLAQCRAASEARYKDLQENGSARQLHTSWAAEKDLCAVCKRVFASEEACSAYEDFRVEQFVQRRIHACQRKKLVSAEALNKLIVAAKARCMATDQVMRKIEAACAREKYRIEGAFAPARWLGWQAAFKGFATGSYHDETPLVHAMVFFVTRRLCYGYLALTLLGSAIGFQSVEGYMRNGADGVKATYARVLLEPAKAWSYLLESQRLFAEHSFRDTPGTHQWEYLAGGCMRGMWCAALAFVLAAPLNLVRQGIRIREWHRYNAAPRPVLIPGDDAAKVRAMNQLPPAPGGFYWSGDGIAKGHNHQHPLLNQPAYPANVDRFKAHAYTVLERVARNSNGYFRAGRIRGQCLSPLLGIPSAGLFNQNLNEAFVFETLLERMSDQGYSPKWLRQTRAMFYLFPITSGGNDIKLGWSFVCRRSLTDLDVLMIIAGRLKWCGLAFVPGVNLLAAACGIRKYILGARPRYTCPWDEHRCHGILETEEATAAYKPGNQWREDAIHFFELITSNLSREFNIEAHL